jgi:putative intracellular protease/amidase
VAEQVRRCGQIQQDDPGQGQRHDPVRSDWHEFDYTCHHCHLRGSYGETSIAAMTNASQLPVTRSLVFDGFDDLDTVGPLEVLSSAGFAPALVRPVGTAATIRSAHGLRLTVDDQLTLDAPPQLLLIPGGGWLDGAAGVRDQTRTELPALLARLHARGTVLASVCTGAMLLAAAGLVRGRPAVTNRNALADLEAAGADVRANARVVDDGEIVTGGGPGAGLDLGLRLVARFRGDEVAAAVAAAIEHRPAGPVIVTDRSAAGFSVTLVGSA